MLTLIICLFLIFAVNCNSSARTTKRRHMVHTDRRERVSTVGDFGKLQSQKNTNILKVKSLSFLLNTKVMQTVSILREANFSQVQ